MFWNVRGWKPDVDNDNFILRSECLLSSDIYILGVAETHLTSRNNLELDGFKWFGNNRKHIHKNARHGSGGIGFLFVMSYC